MKLLSRSLILSILLPFYSHAIVMRHDIEPEKYQVQQAQYESVIDLNFLTGTLIAPQWILTAAHGTPYMPSNQEITINQQKYNVMYIIQHPEYNKDTLSHDITLLKLDRPVPNVTSTGIYTLADEKSQHVWFVGRGKIGNGQVGITGSTTVLNQAENIIENAEDLWITFVFDSPQNNALALEGISGPGDSGGPAFINTATGLKVAGVSSHQRNNDNGEGLYGVEEYYSRTSTHQQWIEAVMAKQDDEIEKIALKHLVMNDFQGQRQLTKKDQDQVTALKNKIQTRGRQLLTHVEPIWPKKAMDEKIEGSVTMSFSINFDGSVDNIKIIESTPKRMFEQASIKALSQWRYAKLDKPLTDIKTKFDFTL